MKTTRIAVLILFTALAARAATVAHDYPAGEADRQFAIIGADLKNRAGFASRASETYCNESLILQTDRDPLDVILRRTGALLDDLRGRDAAKTDDAKEQPAPSSGFWSSLFSRGTKAVAPASPLPRLAVQFASLREEANGIAITNAAVRRELFDRTLALRRQIAFANPLLDFDELLFIKRHRGIYNHMCDQFYGITQRPGGGLYVLKNPFGPNPELRDVLTNSVVESGRLKGQRLVGGNGANAKLSWDGVRYLKGDETQGGTFLSPAVSYDAKQIMFAYCECTGDRDQKMHTDASRGHWDVGRAFHIFRVNTDGTGLRQITDGTWNEFDPCWLPNGRVAFISERRGGYLRCGRACPLYNLYDMTPDGDEINLLSIHDSNEWAPSVTHDGRIAWTRWDYVDRHGCIAHMPWITRLDGTDPRALHGNFAPRPLRPDMELNVRAIPASQKFIATAAPHHSQLFGSLVVIDPRVPDNDAMGPVRRLTPDVAFPESQGGREVYGTPWPLSEKYFLCVYDPAMNGDVKPRQAHGDYGIYLVDAFGNKELIYHDPQIGCLSPMPLRPAQKQPVTRAPTVAANAKPAKPGDMGEGTMAVVNIYNTMRPWPTNSKVKEIRILQLLPCSVPSGYDVPHQTGKRIAEAGDSIVPARWVLGTVPVESDGSAYFKVPAYRELFFQLIDERGMAVQSMRSGTAVRNGEKLVCAGCHEPKHTAVTAPDIIPIAMRRAPSEPKPDVEGANPFSYPKLVQPVLDRNCVECHAKEKDKKAPNLARDPVQNKFFASYNNLLKFSFTSYGDGYRTLPGKFGAQASPLIALLEKGHYDVKLSPEDFHRLTLWQDCVSLFYGVFEREPGEAQLRGDPAQPTLQ